jgi:hypothetical protein
MLTKEFFGFVDVLNDGAMSRGCSCGLALAGLPARRADFLSVRAVEQVAHMALDQLKSTPQGKYPREASAQEANVLPPSSAQKLFLCVLDSCVYDFLREFLHDFRVFLSLVFETLSRQRIF